MRAARIASITALLLVAVVATGVAQDRINTPGRYEVNACIAPGLLPSDLDPGLFDLGPGVYRGELRIELRDDGYYEVKFKGNAPNGAMGRSHAIFAPDWAGVKLGPVIVGSSQVQNCITGIDVANLTEASVNGVGIVDGDVYRYIAKFGYQGEILQQKVVPAPAIFRDGGFY
jgi:hypothetical protein